jgi:D-aspartate ligase
VNPTAIVMNMFYTGLGIARSLGEQGIAVIGLTSHRGIGGNFTRYAKVRFCPDSRLEPAALISFLLSLGEELSGPAILFPTRDDDLIFLDRYRAQLSSRFILVLPDNTALEACLDKSDTYRYALAAGISAPRCWTVASVDEMLRVIPELRFPCVLKPVSAYHWRQGGNWQTVGSRKAIAVSSRAEVIGEYEKISLAESRALIQDLVVGGDDSLWIAACYLDRHSKFVAGFTVQKLLQVPEGFGTGCIVQSVDCPELLAIAARLLQSMHFSGIAEVEFKRDTISGEYMLIEINPRPWDQHRLGHGCGVDLIHIAYCDLAGLPLPGIGQARAGQKWIAEDVLLLLLLRSLWKRDRSFRKVLRLARGKRIYAMWSAADPLPLVGFLATRFAGQMLMLLAQYIRSFLHRLKLGSRPNPALSCKTPMEKAKCKD